ncbi:hypothetical protein LWE61_15810 [Sphingobium sufflavum]|uniref:hypothetical protein n=1 Tax=Sphingobium sufflavum TaxID=1129547 RepID=UPI001F25D739|nr:hypothetical protein [Sphingobium sufflavum]MCE7798014.1 hypothetical protein [Sphingobium sufflavum]
MADRAPSLPSIAPEPAFSDPAHAPYAVSAAERDAIAAAIDTDELVQLALTLGNIPSRSREEAAAAAFVHDWMAVEGFRPRRIGATPERPNIIGEYGGTAPGANLLFTATSTPKAPAPCRSRTPSAIGTPPSPIPSGRNAGSRMARCAATPSRMIAARCPAS